MVIAYFVSAHGLGHAARAAAVMGAAAMRAPQARFEIFTTAPAWFFADELGDTFGYHEVVTDVGLVQKTAIQEDLPATCARLRQFMPFSPILLARLAERLHALGVDRVVCDISPLGIAAAAAARLPSILIENFTWDWIYAGYLREEPGLQSAITHLAAIFAAADYHIQTEPVCAPDPAAWWVHPISRPLRVPAKAVRQGLEIDVDMPVILLTMGGVPWDYAFLDRLAALWPVHFLLPGAPGLPDSAAPFARPAPNVRLLPARSTWRHPDLLAAADAVVGKLGYSTVAEAYYAGLPFGYVTRPAFRESEIIQHFVAARLGSIGIDAGRFASGDWLSPSAQTGSALLSDLLALPKRLPNHPNGADEAAAFLLNLP